MLSMRFKVPVLVGWVMLVLGFIGVVCTDVSKEGAWQYWRVLALIYALMSLGVNLYLRKKGWKTTLYSFWHELWHWVGLLLCVSLISYLVKIGIISRFLAGLQILTLLALSTYLIGVYIEITFIPIGIVLGLCAVGIAFFDQYLYAIAIPVLLIASGIVLWLVHRAHKGTNE
ncbi:MAG TPA: hypothetical protein VGJ00_06890 [Rhabdochlamydiaceae bacterium]|jgi:hypothetical protein